MSTAKDNVQNNGVIDFGDGITATPNADGTYTVNSNDPEVESGVYERTDASNPDAIQIDNTGTQFDGQYWVKLN